jgi:hypothetical protein
LSGTTLTFSTAPPSGTGNVEVVWTQPLPVGTPSDGTVTTAKIVDANVTPTKLSTGGPSWTSGGNIGIGTATPAASLSITKQTTALSGTSNAYGIYVYPTSSGLTYIDAVTSASGATSLGFRTYNNGTYNDAVRIDSSGNVGIGVTPSAWSGYTALQTAGPSVWGTTGVGHLSVNTYFDGTNYKYISTSAATDYYQLSGTHVWRYAASGAAGTNVSFSEAMRIDTSGNVQVGGTTVANTVGYVNSRTNTRAWVRWTGSTGAVVSSYNVSSVTRNSTGDYTVNYTTSLADANYAVIGMHAGDASYASYGVYIQQKSAPTTSSCAFTTRSNAGVYVDPITVNLVIFGN